jgi:purine-binding chemotaxis protein CheW
MAEIENQLQLVTFQLGSEKYGIDIMEVKEIVRNQEVRPIPNSPAWVQGLLNLRGKIIPIIDLHERFQLGRLKPEEDDDTDPGGIMVVTISGRELGIVIDRILRVLSIDSSDLQVPPQMMSGIGTEYVQNVVKEDDDYLIILNTRRLFNSRELQSLTALV